MAHDKIIIKGACEHNLKCIDVEIPRDRLVVITGLSGSGKSTLAFDTIYAEGQRRYVESLSSYARQFLEQMEKPDVESIEGLSPAISIEQKTTSKNPRSTVGTVTEIYDYLRLLFARVGHPHCPSCNKEITSQTVSQMVDQIMILPAGTKLTLLAPMIRGRKGEYKKELTQLRKEGFTRVVVDGTVRELADDIEMDKKKKHDIDIVVDRIVVKEGIQRRLADSLETALHHAEGVVKVAAIAPIPIPLPTSPLKGEELLKSPPLQGEGQGGCVGKKTPKPQTLLFSEKLACVDCGLSYQEITPRLFSFNNPHGACPDCTGLGTRMYFDAELVIPNQELSLREGAIAPWEKRLSGWFHLILDALAKAYSFDIRTPFKELPEHVRDVILNGSKGEKIEFWWEEDGERRHTYQKEFEGVLNNLQRRWRETESDTSREELEKYMNIMPCPTCQGARLRPEALHVLVGGKTIRDVTALSIRDCLAFFEGLNPPHPPPNLPLEGGGAIKFPPFQGEGQGGDGVRSTNKLSDKEQEIGRRILKEIRERLSFLVNVGLDYLSLDRTSGTLSGGEGQRIRLATQIGSSLVGVLYILDEPSIGLHQRDNARLLGTLKRLRDIGNTVLVVEHDEETILEADHLIDMGPGAGVHGGEVVAQGTPAEVMKNPASLTGRYLSGELSIAVPTKRRKGDKSLSIIGASENNLKDVTVEIPLGIMTCVTGVSGSGKSTLVIDTLHKVLGQRLYRSREKAGAVRDVQGLEHLDKVINIDQSPIGRTPRSNPATYTAVFGDIRDLFSNLPESKLRGYKPGRYSFNVKGGRCEACSGDGIIKIEMHFLPDVYVECEVCKGARYNRETLEVHFKGKSIADVLDMTVSQALEFMGAIPRIKNKLATLDEVGLGYIKLGQAATTLSGGEAQRVKLSKELSKRATGRTIYILDEPTTGLHFHDIAKLLEVIQRLVEAGNTIVIIEHNLDVIKTADWIIDLGPEGGDRGGEIIAVGTPEQVAKVTRSYTGQYLRKML
jgi:excinuclease ABC subunit A